MDTYVKTLTFQTNFKDVIKQTQEMNDGIKDFAKYLDVSISSSKVAKSIKGFAKNINKVVSSETVQSFAKSFNKELSEHLHQGSDIGTAAGKKFSKMLDGVGRSIKNFFSDLLKQAKKTMSDMASYNLKSSLTYNSSAWDIAMTKGLTGGDAYAYQKAMEDINVSNDEELMEAMMSPALQERFSQRIGYWSNEYNELNQSGFLKTYQEFTTEWTDFKNEMSVDLIKFFVDNKDTIKATMKGLMWFMNTTVKLIGDILKMFGYEPNRTDSQIAARTTDIVNNYKTSNSATNVTVSNTFNVTGSNTVDNSKLNDAGQTVYRQIINALK